MATPLEKREGSLGNLSFHQSLTFPSHPFLSSSSLPPFFLSVFDPLFCYVSSPWWAPWPLTRFSVDWITIFFSLLHFVLVFSRIPSSPLFFFFFCFCHCHASSRSPSCRCHPRGGLTPLDLLLVVLRAGHHPPWWFPLWHRLFLLETTRVFQPCCIITGWTGSPWPDSNQTQTKNEKKKKITLFLSYAPFFISGQARFCEFWNNMKTTICTFFTHAPSFMLGLARFCEVRNTIKIVI